MSEARLYTLSVSHPGLASRLALERKGVEHRVVELLPGFHPVLVRALGFRHSTVPALRIDGRRVQGSLAIVRYLEATRPEPPLYPADPTLRRAVEEAERWGEAVLQPLPRRIFRYMATHSQRVRRWLAVEVGMPLPGVAAALELPIAAALARKVGVTRERIRADLTELPATLDRVDELIAAGTIGGSEPNAADLQILTSIRSLGCFADLEPILRGRPCEGAAARVVPPMPGSYPPALPPEWLGPRRAAPAAAGAASR